MAAKGMPRCAQHAAEGLPRCAVRLPRCAAWLPRGCRVQGSLAAERLPSARQLSCREGQHGCRGNAECSAALLPRGCRVDAAMRSKAARGCAPRQPRGCRVQGRMAVEGMPRCQAAWLSRGCKLMIFTFCETWVNSVPNGHANICIYEGECQVGFRAAWRSSSQSRGGTFFTFLGRMDELRASQLACQ